MRSPPPVARCAALLMSMAALLATAVSASAEAPDWAKRCAATTKNPWITSGYCEAHQAWSKYYCQCAFVPSSEGVDLRAGRRSTGDNAHDDTGDQDFPDDN